MSAMVRPTTEPASMFSDPEVEVEIDGGIQ